MSQNKDNIIIKFVHNVKVILFTPKIFIKLMQLCFVFGFLLSLYWIFIASDRYVSEAIVILEKTDSSSAHMADASQLLASFGGAVGKNDQLLLREYLMSVDILLKLDSALDLRAHYSDTTKDIVSRMWDKDCDIEWFHRHYISRINIVYDDYAGVLRIKASAYDAKTAQAIAQMLVNEGEQFMNSLAQELATAQVNFLTNETQKAYDRLLKSNNALLAFQNAKGLVSPQETTESINAIIAKLEAQRTEFVTQLAVYPSNLAKDNPSILVLKKSIEAIDKQIALERARLASPVKDKNSLNYTVEQFKRLEMDVSFSKDLYKSALIGLEKGRIDATRTIKKVSVLQKPGLPEYPIEPTRIYNIVVTLLSTLIIAGILKLMEGIVRDHVD